MCLVSGLVPGLMWCRIAGSGLVCDVWSGITFDYVVIQVVIRMMVPMVVMAGLMFMNWILISNFSVILIYLLIVTLDLIVSCDSVSHWDCSFVSDLWIHDFGIEFL